MRRHMRSRKKIRGTADCPRMSVFVSNRHMYVQCIDDDAARTLVAASTMTEALKDGNNNKDKAQALGKHVAELAKAKGIEQVVFDRGGFAYEGRVQALADAAREVGLKF